MDEAGPKPFDTRFRYRRFLVLMVTLVLLSVLHPSFGDGSRGLLGLNFLFTLMLLSATLAATENRTVFIVSIILAALAILLRWLDYNLDVKSITLIHFATELGFLGLTLVVVLKHVMHSGPVHADRIFAAICGYLLIGILWAECYWTLELLQPGSFEAGMVMAEDGNTLSRRETLQTLLYYSFVTLSTLGFGDIVPRSSAAQTMSWSEAVVGQLYLAVLVARLVGLYCTQEVQAFHENRQRDG